MKAFTVYQPYAHAIVAGVKHYETRPRRTHIRGRVAVHAGRLDEVQATKHLTNGEFWAVLEAAGGGGNLQRKAQRNDTVHPSDFRPRTGRLY